MSATEWMRTLLDRRRPQFSLEQPFYMDQDVFDLDMRAIFARHWIFAGLDCELPEVGSFFTVAIGRTSVIVLRDRHGELRAFHNVCRHRGSIICDAERGRRPVLTCPYHHWSYDLSGRLVRVPQMHDGFDKSEYALRPVAVASASGTIYVCLADAPPDFASFAAALQPMLGPHAIADAKVAHEIHLHERANWKLVLENSRECDHCMSGHPELMRTLLHGFSFADPESDPAIAAFLARTEALGIAGRPARGPDFQIARFPLVGDAVSVTLDGQPAVSRRLGALPSDDLGSLRWSRYPSTFNHAYADYAVFVRLLPLGPEETLVTAKFVVPAAAAAGRDYDLENLIRVWRETNDQDRRLVERNQRGVASAGYQPGPYARDTEIGVWRFVEWYCDAMQAFLGHSAHRLHAAE